MSNGQQSTRVALAGCGTMGRALAHAVFTGQAGSAELAAVYDQDPERAATLAASAPPGCVPPRVAVTVDDLVQTPSLRLVVECASQRAVHAIAVPTVEAGKDLLTISSGALLDPGLSSRLQEACGRTGANVFVPSGAIGGIDAIRAVRRLLEDVTLVSTKPPAAYSGAPGFEQFKGSDFSSPVVLFDGPAGDAVPLFPANVNVAATLSLAGLGPAKTRVKVVADPASPGNVHEIVARGSFGEMRLRFANRPHPDNSRTSALAVYSAIEALRRYCSGGARIGS